MASLIFEAFKYQKHRPIARITVAIIFLMVALMMFFTKEEPPIEGETINSSLELGGFVLLFTVWIIFFMSIFTNFILIRAYRNEGEISALNDGTQVAPLHKGTLPVGFFKKRDLIIFGGVFFVTILLPIGLFFYVQFAVNDNLVLNALILFVTLLFLSVVLIVIYVNITNAPFRQFERDLNYPKVIEVIDRYRANEKLHPETSNFLLILKANYTLNYDRQLAESLWQDVAVPTNISYRLMYDLVTIERITWKLDFEGAKNYMLEALKNNKQPNVKIQLNRKLKMNQAFVEGINEHEVDKLWPLQSKNKLFVIQNLSLRILYYYMRNNLTLANSSFASLSQLSPESHGIIETIKTLLNNPKN